MTFPCTCPSCEHVNHVEWSRIGREMYCGGCGKPFTVPAPMETVARPARPRDTVTFRCPACSKKYSTSGRLAGQKIRCKGCGGGVRVPGEGPASSGSPNFKRKFSGEGDASAPGPQSGSKAEAPSAQHELPDLDRIPASPPEAPNPTGDRPEDEDEESVDDYLPVLEDDSALQIRRRRTQEAVLSSRSEAMARVSREVAEEEANKTRRKQEQALKRAWQQKQLRSSYFDPRETLRLVGWISAFVGVLAFLAWGYPDFRFPLGGMLCVTGFIVYLLGWASMKQLAAEEGAIQAIAFRFFPPYQWWFVWTRWGETKDHAIFFAAGFLIMLIGVAVLKISPAGQRAERSERAYRKLMEQGPRESPPPPAISTDPGIDKN